MEALGLLHETALLPVVKEQSQGFLPTSAPTYRTA